MLQVRRASVAGVRLFLVFLPPVSPGGMPLDCILPANPDISGIGVRVAIYIQNFLSFIPAFWALQDGKVTRKELRIVEKQATTILVTAFAILISAIVQAGTFNLSSLHTSIVLNLSWMNNTNVFIYFLLYIHHMSDPKRRDKQVQPRWSTWAQHVYGLLIRPHSTTKLGDEEQDTGTISGEKRLGVLQRTKLKIMYSPLSQQNVPLFEMARYV
jgi:hypothetical protein